MHDVGFLSSGCMPGTKGVPNHRTQQIQMLPDHINLITRTAKTKPISAKQQQSPCMVMHMVLSDFVGTVH